MVPRLLLSIVLNLTATKVLQMVMTSVNHLVLAFMVAMIMDVLGVAGTQDVCVNDWVHLTHHYICAVTGSSVVIPCSLTPPSGHTITKIFWLIRANPGGEPQDVYENKSYTGRVKYFWDENTNRNNCTLKLSDLKMTDSTAYRARILTDQAKWQSCSIVQLSVTELTVWLPEMVFEGNEVKLSCNTICRLKDNPTVIWRKNGDDLPDKQTHNSELLLQKVSTEDAGDYSCALTGYEKHKSKPVKLNVLFSPKNTSVSVTPDVITKGSSVTLTCSSDANPPVENYTWFKVNESTPVGSGQQYNITNIRSEDGGQYYCQARSRHGAQNSSVMVITLPGYHRSWLYVTTGVSVCGAASLICALRYIRRRKKTIPSNSHSGNTDKNIQDDVDYENDSFGGSQDLNPNTTQPDAVYQSLNPNTTQPDAVYQSLNP